MAPTKKTPRPPLSKGRPKGIPQPTAIHRIQRDKDKILNAVHRQALLGNPDAARLALEVSGAMDLTEEEARQDDVHQRRRAKLAAKRAK
jgi:hypothetical protein